MTGNPEHAENVARYWAPRVKPSAIRRLYETDASGILDAELIDEVGYTLFLRCETIWIVTERRCPECREKLARTGEDDAIVTCPQCNWSTPWRRYHKSYKGKRIHGGRAYSAFIAFMEEFPKLKTPRARMLSIDRLIHAMHETEDHVWTTPAANNLIEGSREETIDLLDDLAYGDSNPEEMRRRKEEWRRKMAATEIATAKFHEERQNRKERKAQRQRTMESRSGKPD